MNPAEAFQHTGQEPIPLCVECGRPVSEIARDGCRMNPRKCPQELTSLTPAAVNASWFAALKGRVLDATVHFPCVHVSLAHSDFLLSTCEGNISLYRVPTWVTDEQRINVARSDCAPTLIGFGTSPAAAIADFNAKMVAEQ